MFSIIYYECREGDISVKIRTLAGLSPSVENDIAAHRLRIEEEYGLKGI